MLGNEARATEAKQVSLPQSCTCRRGPLPLQMSIYSRVKYSTRCVNSFAVVWRPFRRINRRGERKSDAGMSKKTEGFSDPRSRAFAQASFLAFSFTRPITCLFFVNNNKKLVQLPPRLSPPSSPPSPSPASPIPARRAPTQARILLPRGSSSSSRRRSTPSASAAAAAAARLPKKSAAATTTRLPRPPPRPFLLLPLLLRLLLPLLLLLLVLLLLFRALPVPWRP